MSAQDAEQAVRGFFAAYTDGDPGKCDTVVADDYTDYKTRHDGNGGRPA